MRVWQFYAVLGAGLIAWSGVMVGTGKLIAEKACEKQKTESAIDAVEEMNRDATDQKTAGSEIAADYQAEANRLRRKLAEAYNARSDDGDTCLDVADGDSMHNAYDQIFAPELRP